MKSLYLSACITLAVLGSAQAEQNCNQLITGLENQMVAAVTAATRTTEQSPAFCKAQFAARDAITNWLEAAKTCRSRMADYENRVSQATGTRRSVLFVLAAKCKIN